MISLISDGPTENWLRASDLAATIKRDDRKAIIALRLHYEGSGYSSRMVGEATKLEESLHYRNERSMKFSTFTAKLQHIFNLYRDHDTAVSNDTKLRLLSRKITSPALVNCLAFLESRVDLTCLTFEEAISHITTVISRHKSSLTYVSNVYIASTGSTYGGQGRGPFSRGVRGCDNRYGGRGRGRGRGDEKSPWIPRDSWEKMSPQEKYAAKYPDNEGESKSLDQNTLSIISVVSQATVVNLSRPDSLPPHINTSKSTSCSGNSFGGRDEAKRQKWATDNPPSALTVDGVKYKISAFRTISSKITTIAISSTINKALAGQLIFGTCELGSHLVHVN